MSFDIFLAYYVYVYKSHIVLLNDIHAHIIKKICTKRIWIHLGEWTSYVFDIR